MANVPASVPHCCTSLPQTCGSLLSIYIIVTLVGSIKCVSYESGHFICTCSASEKKTCSLAGQLLVADVILGL